VLAPFAGAVEGVSDHAFDTLPRENIGLNRNLVSEPRVDAPTDACVLALGVLTDTEHVDVFRPLVSQRAGDSGKELDRPSVDVEVEPLPDGQQEPPQSDVVGHCWRSHGAEVDGIEAAQDGKPVLRHHPPVLEVVLTAPGHLLAVECERPVELCRPLEHPKPGRQDFLSHSISGYERDTKAIQANLRGQS